MTLLEAIARAIGRSRGAPADEWHWFQEDAQAALDAIAAAGPNQQQLLLLGLLSGAGPQSREQYIEVYRALIAAAREV
jgi:hypothetical protein